MPDLDSTLHLDMYRASQRRRGIAGRIRRALKVLLTKDELYGLEWGDPETSPPLGYVRDHFLRPYATPLAHTVEIGPGGGRWTRYMLGVERLYAVDYHQELLDELASRFRTDNLTFIRNAGSDLPGVPDAAIDFIFSFGTFVHLEVRLIGQYLDSIKRVLKPSSNVVLQYADKTKPLGRSNSGFSQNDPETMRQLIRSRGYVIYEEDTQTLWHSSIVRFGIRPADGLVAQDG